MSMSKDRVHFTLPDCYNYRAGYPELLQETLGLKPNEARSMCNASASTQVKIICRPSQFARFLIRRNELGMSNEFKNLAPRLVPEQHTTMIDVSTRPARHNDDPFSGLK